MRYLSLFILSIIANIAFSQALKWDKATHQYGAFREDVGPVDCVFTAVNTSDKPVVVVSSQANCGCTRPTYDKNSVAPGDTLRLSVTYNPDGRPGRFNKTIRLTTDEANYRLAIRGTVIASAGTLASRYPVTAGPTRITNSVVPFGETVKGRTLSGAVNIYNPTSDTIVPAIAYKPMYINAIFNQPNIAPGTENMLSFTCYTDICPSWGTVTDSIIFIPDNRFPDKTIKLSTVAIIKEDFSKLTAEQRKKAPIANLSLTHVDFPDLSADNCSTSVTLTNSGASPLLIRRIFCPDDAIEVSIDTDKIKPRKQGTISIKVNPNLLPADNALNSRITVITNDPEHPTQIIKVTALK